MIDLIILRDRFSEAHALLANALMTIGAIVDGEPSIRGCDTTKLEKFWRSAGTQARADIEIGLDALTDLHTTADISDAPDPHRE